jgi:hypothetical protein
MDLYGVKTMYDVRLLAGTYGVYKHTFQSKNFESGMPWGV